jgi:hypothetical protein
MHIWINVYIILKIIKNLKVSLRVSQKYVPLQCWQYLDWQKKQYYLILAAMKTCSNCLKSCRSRFQGPSAISHLDSLPDLILDRWVGHDGSDLNNG